MISYFWVPLLYHGNLNMLTFISILCKSCFCIKSTFFGSIWSAILQTTVNFNFKIVFITLLTYCGTKQCIFKRNLLQKCANANLKYVNGKIFDKWWGQIVSQVLTLRAKRRKIKHNSSEISNVCFEFWGLMYFGVSPISFHGWIRESLYCCSTSN